MTRGRDALLAVLMRTSGREVARRCRVSPSRVSEWCSGRTRPNTSAREVLDRCYRIPANAWDEPMPPTLRERIARLLR